MRWPLVFSMPLLIGSASPSIPDARGMGEILAKADGPNLFVTALFFLLFLQFVERLWSSGSSARAITKASETMAQAVNRSTDATEAMHAAITAEMFLLRSQVGILLDRREQGK